MKKILPLVLLFWLLDVSALAQEIQPRAIRNIVYKTVDGQELKLNLFLPVQNGALRRGEPLLLNIDAGCWYSGEPGDGGYWKNFHAVEKGFAVASVTHRSVAVAPFPAQIEDVKAAIRFLRAHADEYGYDKNRIACMGYSSGGHISCMMGIPDDVKIFDVGENLNESSQVQRVINFYGPTSLDVMSEAPCVECVYKVLGAPTINGKQSREITPERRALAKRCSPLTYASAKSAPTLHFYGVMDRTVPLSQGVLFYEALYRAGVRTELFISNTGVHAVPSIAEDATLAEKIDAFLGWNPLKE